MHYPGWEPRWDEWVPRERLRWGNERRAAALKGVSSQEGDSVEMWCEGVHVPGAWLEAVVHTVKNGRLYLGEVSKLVVGVVKNETGGSEAGSGAYNGRLVEGATGFVFAFISHVHAVLAVLGLWPSVACARRRKDYWYVSRLGTEKNTANVGSLRLRS